MFLVYSNYDIRNLKLEDQVPDTLIPAICSTGGKRIRILELEEKICKITSLFQANLRGSSVYIYSRVKFNK